MNPFLAPFWSLTAWLSKRGRKLPTMNITEDHWLDGVERQILPGGAPMETRRFLVIHNTSGWSAMSSVEGWREAGDGICAHLIIDRDGKIIQCRPFNRTCGHAGRSAWRDPNTDIKYSGLNACAIGIELANAADMGRTPDVYPGYLMGELAGKAIPRTVARHKNGGGVKEWETYPEAQLQACEAVSRALVTRYKLDDVLGHDDCAPDRKVDPGPAFPMQTFRNALGFLKALPKLR